MIAALYHGLSINNLVVAANTGDISKHYTSTVLIDGILSAMLLFSTAVWLLFLSVDLKKFSRKAWLQGVFIGLTLTVFGASLWYRYPASLHLPAFLVTGLILLIPLLVFGRSFKQ
jgi:hypothetical protein